MFGACREGCWQGAGCYKLLGEPADEFHGCGGKCHGATEYATLNKKADGTLPTYEEVKAVYDKYYKNEKFVRVLEKDICPETKWVEGSNYVDVNFKIDERTGRIVMMGALDNLVKGAAGQAVQNMNLLFGFDEAEGLNLVPMFP